METLENTTVKFTTRNDPSIIPRIYAVCEAMVRIAVLDCMYMTESLKAFCNL
jgi:chorismate synthase